jgi:hypothetical protein
LIVAIVFRGIKKRQVMENFVLAGKAKTVFKLIALKAKIEAEKERKAKEKRESR